MGKLYWIAAAFFAALATHAAFVLAVPAYTLDRSLSSVLEHAGANHFVVLKPEDQQRLFPGYPPNSVAGICAFDVSKADVKFTADMAPGYWTLTIYSRSGQVLYALNDTQAGSGQFTVKLKRAPGLIEMLTQPGSDDAIAEAGWNLDTPEPRGIAVLWQPAGDPAERAGIQRGLAKTSCAPMPPKASVSVPSAATKA